MTKELILAGFGGQGILFTGKVLVYSGLLEGKEVSWLPSYGPEMRGGTANCSVCICDEPVASPLVTEPDYLIAMNTPSFEKFINAVKPGGMVFADEELVEANTDRTDITVFSIPASKLASDNGLNGAANMILLGKLIKETEMFSLDEIKAGLGKSIPPRKANLLDSNVKAVMLGMES